MATTSTNTGLIQAATEALIDMKIGDALPKVTINFASGAVKGDTVKVPLISGEADSFNSSSNNYLTGSGEASMISVVLNKHAKSSFDIEQEDLNKFAYKNLVDSAVAAVIAKIKADIYAGFTHTNDDVIGLSTAFDYAAFVAAQGLGDDYNMGNKSMALSPAYVNALFADKDVAAALSRNGQLAGKTGEVTLLDTRIEKTKTLPAGAVGVLHDDKALVVAFGAPTIGKGKVTEIVDDVTGYTLFVREVENDGTGSVVVTVESVYGIAKGLETATILKSA